MLTTSTGKPTRAQEARFRQIKWSGCICCLKKGFPDVPPEIHHLLSGGRRRGHDATVGLCGWHHRGVLDGRTREALEAVLGPSLQLTSRGFHLVFGSDDDLLAFQNEVIGCAG